VVSRSVVAWFVLIIGLSATIFFFIAQEDATALTVLFLTVYCTISIFYFLKILYYIEYNATLNEFYFLLISNMIPFLIFLVSPVIPINQAKILEFYAGIEPNYYEQPLISVSMLSILSLPYLVVSASLLVRCFTKYEFIRIGSQSSKGPSAEWTALIIYFIFGPLFLLVGLISGDLVSILSGLFFTFSGIVFFIGK
jgi:hypothetical protein